MRVWVPAAAVLAMTMQTASKPPLTLVQTIELPRVEGRIDHLAFDATSGKLFVAALGNNTVEVIDVKNTVHLKSLTGFREPQGIAIATDANVVAVANGHGEGVQLINASDFQPGKSVSLGDDSDNVRYDAAVKRLYVGYGGGAIAALDPAGTTAVGTVKLAGHPESFQLERSGPRMFVNVPSAGHIAVIDRSAMRVTGTWPVTEARSNYPMALDEANHRLFVGCRNPARVLVYDTQTGKSIGSGDIVGDTDDMFFDAKLNRLYVAGGEGFIDVLDTRPDAKLARIARIKTDAGARTALFTPDQRRLYLAVPHRGAQKASIKVYEVQESVP
jgi:DNA-binding beta-propeller fold protein YncE